MLHIKHPFCCFLNRSIHPDQLPVHDHIDPEDQYIDTTLCQSRVDPELLLAEQNRSRAFAPMERHVSTEAETRTAHRQSLLPDANDNNHDRSEPAGARRLLADEEVFAPMDGFETSANEEADLSASNSLAFLEETRQRFKQLEKEAEVC